MASKLKACTALFAVCALVGCKATQQVRDPDYPQVSHAIQASWQAPLPDTQLLNPVAHELAGPQSLDAYIQFALSQNPSIQAARKRVDAAAMRVPQAASLKDPMLDANGWPFFPNVPQTASGRMQADVKVSQEIPWRGKLRARAAAAEEEANAARAQFAATELKVIEDVKRAYYELYFTQSAIRVTQQDRTILAELVQVANVRYQTGNASQQDVLRLQAEVSNVDGELIRMGQMRSAAQAEMAQLLHISPETPLAAVEELWPQQLPRDIESLYRQAVESRPELHAMLSEIERDRRKVDAARLEYFPDATFSFGWGPMTTSQAIAPTADGIDNLMVGINMNLPVYRAKLNAAVREAESTVVASARQYDAAKDETQRDVRRLFTQAKSQQEMEALLRESVIPKTRQALEVSFRGYQVGETEFADLIASWRELLRFHIAQLQLESQLRQTLATLERVIGGPVPSPVPSPPENGPVALRRQYHDPNSWQHPSSNIEFREI